MKNRQRGRNGKQRPPGRNPNFDGGNRPRGNAQQLMEKYLMMARDASASGDRVLAENYFQHADHYYRVLNARFEQNNGQRRFNEGGHQQSDYHQSYSDGVNEGGEGNPQFQGNPQYQGAPDQQPQHNYNQQQPQPQPQADQDIGLPPGILGVGGNEAQPNMGENQAGYDQGQDGGHQDGGRHEGGRHEGGRHDGGRHRGRHRRGRGDRPFAGNPGE